MGDGPFWTPRRVIVLYARLGPLGCYSPYTIEGVTPYIKRFLECPGVLQPLYPRGCDSLYKAVPEMPWGVTTLIPQRV